MQKTFLSLLAKLAKLLLPERIKTGIRCVQMFHRRLGYFPNIFFPKTFNEKILRRKLFDRDPMLALRADKVLVKQYVSRKIGSQYVIPTLWCGSKLPLREMRNWAIPFVIKANHGCGWNFFVRSEQDCDWDRIEQLCKEWMSRTYARQLGEWLYSRIDPQIMVEPFIGRTAKLPIDYKLWVFGGTVHLIEVIVDREAEIKEVLYDRAWNRLPFRYGLPAALEEFPKPGTLQQMIESAEALAEGNPFVRADFYDIDGQLYFGELTFYPASGLQPFFPAEYDRKIGGLWG